MLIIKNFLSVAKMASLVYEKKIAPATLVYKRFTSGNHCVIEHAGKYVHVIVSMTG